MVKVTYEKLYNEGLELGYKPTKKVLMGLIEKAYWAWKNRLISKKQYLDLKAGYMDNYAYANGGTYHESV